jgi:hypothetical protein
MGRIKGIPFHPIAFAAFPVLALYAHNILEIEGAAILRPLLFLLGAAGITWLILAIFLRDGRRAALVTTYILVLFESYGNLYPYIEGLTIAGFNIGRHRYLLAFYAVLLVAGVVWLAKKPKDIDNVTQALNLCALFLLAFPAIQIAIHTSQVTASQAQTEQLPALAQTQSLVPPERSPDIYYIILDGYTRADSLEKDLGFDNTPFIEELESLGFYVAPCSRSNYLHTLPSLSTTLNMTYLPELQKIFGVKELSRVQMSTLIQQSLVRRELADAGYQIVGFESTYKWTRLTDADIYLALSSKPISLHGLNQFETMLANGTALRPLIELQYSSLQPHFRDDTHPFYDEVLGQLFILEQTPRIADLSAPTFAFIHLLPPHVPYMFGPNGEILTDPGYFTGGATEPINEKYQRMGYTGEVQFMNREMLRIVRYILEKSSTPPIIVIQGDHGLRRDNRPKILDAYYLPGAGKDRLYSSITPVNSFRVIFDAYFGTHYGLLEDVSYSDVDYVTPIPETSPGCLPSP